MTSEPAPDLTIEQATDLCNQIETEQELAHLFACVSNKACWLSDELYDYTFDSAEYKKLRDCVDPWFSLMQNLLVKICDILIAEGVKIPDKGKILVLTPFMERNGFRNGNGWWIKVGSNHAV